MEAGRYRSTRQLVTYTVWSGPGDGVARYSLMTDTESVTASRTDSDFAVV